ncbi:MAG TPA: hypothetical protein VF229_01525, partial [Burkholderiaceae bacterium]
MGFKRFTAATAREALDRVRRELGDEAVILSNRKLGPGRIEIIAAAPDAVQALVDEVEPPSHRAPRAPDGRAFPARQAPESFEEFVRRQSAASPRAPGGENATAGRHDQVAMYHEVAHTPIETPPAAQGAGRVAEARPAEATAAARPEAPPAVFRRRPSRLEEQERTLAAAPPPADPQPPAATRAEP